MIVIYVFVAISGTILICLITCSILKRCCHKDTTKPPKVEKPKKLKDRKDKKEKKVEQGSA
jgi:hypothetical protein